MDTTSDKSRVIFLSLDKCGVCKTFQHKIWPIICNKIENDPLLANKVSTSVHRIGNGASGYSPPIGATSMDEVFGRNYPILIVLGPGEDKLPYKIKNDNIYPDRIISGRLIVSNSVKSKVTHLDWTIRTLREKIQNSSKPPTRKLSPPNRQLTTEYVHPRTTSRLKSSDLTPL